MGGIMRTSVAAGCGGSSGGFAGGCGQALGRLRLTTPQTVVDVLHELSDKAEVIFAGQVLAVRRPGTKEWWRLSFVWTRRFAVVRLGRLMCCGSGMVCGRVVIQRYRVGQRSADVAACAGCCGDELAGGWTGWGDSDSAGWMRDADGG